MSMFRARDDLRFQDDNSCSTSEGCGRMPKSIPESPHKGQMYSAIPQLSRVTGNGCPSLSQRLGVHLGFGELVSSIAVGAMVYRCQFTVVYSASLAPLALGWVVLALSFWLMLVIPYSWGKRSLLLLTCRMPMPVVLVTRINSKHCERTF